MFTLQPVRAALVLALALAMPGLALAEDSESETPPEEQELAQSYEMPKGVRNFLDYLQDFDTRYPDSDLVDPKVLMATEGETFALHFCAAVGIDGPCVPAVDKQGNDTYLPAVAGVLRGDGDGEQQWYEWLARNMFNVGVIPEVASCPAGTSMTIIHHDDEDRRNVNSHFGWIGATLATVNTSWLFCKLDPVASLSFRPLAKVGDAYDYSVINMGVLCPSGARRVLRIEEGEVWRNANFSAGGVFPNFRAYNFWFNFYCHFDGGASSALGQMNAFPQLRAAYGVYAPSTMPSSLALKKGRVFQDDEDYLNLNAWWIGSGDQVMMGGRNTDRRTAKVR